MSTEFENFLIKYNIEISYKHPDYKTYRTWITGKVQDPSRHMLNRFIADFGWQFNYHTKELFACFDSKKTFSRRKIIHMISHDVPRLLFFIANKLISDLDKEKKILIIHSSAYDDVSNRLLLPRKTEKDRKVFAFPSIRELYQPGNFQLEPLIQNTQYDNVHLLESEPEPSHAFSNFLMEDKILFSETFSNTIEALNNYDQIIILNGKMDIVSTRIFSNVSDIIVNYALNNINNFVPMAKKDYLKMKINAKYNPHCRNIKIPETPEEIDLPLNHNAKLLSQFADELYEETVEAITTPSEIIQTSTE